jgi:hypothetical protein
MKLLKKIYDKKKNTTHIVYTILGFKIKIKNPQYFFRKNKQEILLGVKRIIAAANLHRETFAGFKNKHNNQDVVLIGAGPTLNYYDPMPDKINVGLNRVFILNNIKFDYLFAIDKIGIEKYYNEFFSYNEKCVKFVGDQNLGIHWQIPETVIKGKNVKRYKTTANYMPSEFSLDIDSEPLGNFNTVSLQAIQFILYTKPKRIYLVGIDCTQGQHFHGNSPDLKGIRNENEKQLALDTIKYWKQLKNFVSIYYPDIEIISINPVGLKGLFRDIYTERYKNSVLLKNIEIVNQEGE